MNILCTYCVILLSTISCGHFRQPAPCITYADPIGTRKELISTWNVKVFVISFEPGPEKLFLWTIISYYMPLHSKLLNCWVTEVYISCLSGAGPLKNLLPELFAYNLSLVTAFMQYIYISVLSLVIIVPFTTAFANVVLGAWEIALAKKPETGG